VRRALAIGLVLAAGVAVSGCAAGFPGSPTYVTDISATINGLVATTDGGSTPYWVEYGTDTSYEHESAHRTRTVPEKSSFLVSIPIAGLSRSTTYHYRVCSERCGDDSTFTTDSPGGHSGIAFTSGRGPGSPLTNRDIVTMDVDGGNPANVTNSSTSADDWPAWSPDGRQIAYTHLTYDSSNRPVGTDQIYVMDAGGANKHPVTNDSANVFEPAWSPDGKKIAVTRAPTGGVTDIYSFDAGGGPLTNLTKTAGSYEAGAAWSPDGSRIAYSYAADAGSLADIYVMNADGSHKRPLTSTADLNEGEPAWSPDGTRVAFWRDLLTSRATDIFEVDADGGTPVDLTNRDGHEGAPSWSPDGTKIAYQEGDLDIFSFTLATGSHTNLTNNNPVEDFEPAWSPRP
jgi:Tol biopolymer transport system component